ncbi:50S ribosomal protein L4 [Candidatus Portiera aleyrodidarum]|uniref:Large ribosomal subunit protein uL4 n=1 Tax=Candidatus Portiera aleyrodidarum TaxID=91844 RepID=A0A6S6S4D2_9GAMM|nr:50S ribosomal protein L4 [Candidatus Portiera aleyrodidarum]CAA3705392.1 50S ribosomal protein L4 [Candidatus Portiera aleyrodidarum]
MKLKIRDTSEKIEVSKEVFDREFKKSLIHQVVTSYIKNSRQGTKAQKKYKNIRGGGKKPWKQKGTGRARAGSIRSPLWRGGCVTFAASKKKYQKKVNRKMYRIAMCAIISQLIRKKRLIVLKEMNVNFIKTKKLIRKLEELNIKNLKSLIITEKENKKFVLSSRNIPNVNPINVRSVNPLSLIKTDKVIITLAALLKLEDKLKI